MQQLINEDHDVEVVWRASELRPHPVPTLDPKGDYLRRVWRDSVYPLSRRLGVPMKLPPVQPRSRRAHEAAHWARTLGHFDEYHAAVFRAFFERGEDIGEVNVLVRLAQELGLNGEALRVALKRREYKDSVLADKNEAEVLNIRSVPAFVADRRVMLSGLHPLENLKELIATARETAGTDRVRNNFRRANGTPHDRLGSS